MEKEFGVVWIIIVIVSAIIRVAAKNKKQAAQKDAAAAPAHPVTETASRTASAPAQPLRPAAQPLRPAAQSQRPAAQPPKPAAPRHAEAAHRSVPLEAHMHEPVMGVEGMGTEGVDCCHEYMLSDPTQQPESALAPAEEKKSMEAQALLQGVIFSEILGRRPIKRYGGKQA